jgi:hypothetical protein
MNKLITTFVIITGLAFTPVFADDMENVQIDMRGYDMIEVPAGTFIPVMSTAEISTATCTEGYKVKFIATDNLYMYETTVVPENSIFYGYIEKINLPVVGTNGSMKIKITKMVLPDGTENPMKGYIYTDNNNLIGGGISDPVKWIKMPHYQSKFEYVNMSLRPSQERKVGTHTAIQAGSNEIIVLTAPMYLTHTLSN